jgi:hypothetical protein
VFNEGKIDMNANKIVFNHAQIVSNGGKIDVNGDEIDVNGNEIGFNEIFMDNKNNLQKLIPNKICITDAKNIINVNQTQKNYDQNLRSR